MSAPQIRAGDADRQQSVDRLARHFTDGRLDSTEYDQRVRRAYACVYLDELPPLFADLPPEPMIVAGHRNAWRQGHGPIDPRGHPGFRGGVPMVRGLRRAAVFGLLAIVLLWIMLVSHGLLFPVPLIWIGLFALTGGRRHHHHPGPRW